MKGVIAVAAHARPWALGLGARRADVLRAPSLPSVAHSTGAHVGAGELDVWDKLGEDEGGASVEPSA